MGELKQEGESAQLPDTSTGWDSLQGYQIGRFAVQERIGSGGVASVYQAYDQVAGRTVALKVLPPQADAGVQARFRREALLAGALRHPNIVRILQIGRAFDGGVGYIAMELVEGESLGELLARRGRLQPDESCRLLAPLARGLAYAHRHGIIHRDVKPSNILLRSASLSTSHGVRMEVVDHPVVPLLTDFGIARYLDEPELTYSGRTVGTPAFMAPEQCAGSRMIDGRADIYSLGAVLFRCVIGRPPFGGTPTQILHAHVYEPLVVEDRMLEDLPASVVEILGRCLEKAPEARYGDADLLAADLELAAREVPVVSGGAESATRTMAALAPVREPPHREALTVLVPVRQETQAGSVVRGVTDRAHSQPLIAQLGAHDRRRRTAGRALAGWLLAGSLMAIAGAGWVYGSMAGGEMTARQMPTPSSTRDAVIQALVVPAVLPASEKAAEITRQGDASGPQVVDVEPQSPTPVPTSTAPAAALEPVSTGTPVRSEGEAPAGLQYVPAMPPGVRIEPAPPEPAEVLQTPADGASGETIAACSNVVDQSLLPAVMELPEGIRREFACPVESVRATAGELLPFERGFMLRLADSSETYVYYADADDWERAVPGAVQETPANAIGRVSPEGLFIPEGAYGALWSVEPRAFALGFARQAEPTMFEARAQTFVGGIVIGNVDDGTTVVLLRSRLRL